jgi:hypothetical protein
MPNHDHTGPQGTGPRTGQQMGDCQKPVPVETPEYGVGAGGQPRGGGRGRCFGGGRGRGRGMGRGRGRHGWHRGGPLATNSPPPTPTDMTEPQSDETGIDTGNR